MMKLYIGTKGSNTAKRLIRVHGKRDGVSVIRPCCSDLSVCVTWSGPPPKKSLENIKNKDKLILTASTAFKC
jgi:hypothetical protein